MDTFATNPWTDSIYQMQDVILLNFECYWFISPKVQIFPIEEHSAWKEIFLNSEFPTTTKRESIEQTTC